MNRACERVLRATLGLYAVALVTSCASKVHHGETTSPEAWSERVSDGAWSVETSAVAGAGTVTGIAKFHGPAGHTRHMGMCLVQRYTSPGAGAVACATPEDCASIAASLPPEGHLYCVRSELDGAGSCHFKPGASETYCAGTPAREQSAVAPGIYRIEVNAAAGSEWRALACFEGCAARPPVASPAVIVR